MERRPNDPAYQAHDMEPSASAGRDADAEGDENSPDQVNVRLNMNAAPPSEVRKTKREHGTEGLSGV